LVLAKDKVTHCCYRNCLFLWLTTHNWLCHILLQWMEEV